MMSIQQPDFLHVLLFAELYNHPPSLGEASKPTQLETEEAVLANEEEGLRPSFGMFRYN